MGFAELVDHVAGDGRRPLACGLVVASVDEAERAPARDALLAAIERRAGREGLPADVVRQVCVLDAAEADLLAPGSGPAAPPALRAAYESLGLIVERLVAWFETGGTASDLIRLEERREALERRVAELEARSALIPAVHDLRPVEGWITARVAVWRSGTGARSLPLLLDDPFRPLRGARKTSLLDLLGRLSARCVLLYLTTDLDVVLWSRRREAAGSVGPVIASAQRSALRAPLR